MKQKTAHQIISALIRKGYCYRQLSECYGLSPSILHAMANNEHYQESPEKRDLLNSKQPADKPRWKRNGK